MYTTSQVAKMARISPYTVRRWIRKGIVPEAKARDNRNYRLFDESEAGRIVSEAERTIPNTA